MRLGPLVALIFFSVSGGAFGLEPLVSGSGPGMAILLLFLTPIIYSIPVALFTAELSSAVPGEGGPYQWVKRALGPFWGFEMGALYWITSWVDMAAYPALFSDYVGTVITPVASGRVSFFSLGPVTFDLHWLVGVVCVVLPATLLNLRGAKRVGDSSIFLGIIVLGPFALLALIGIPQLFINHINPVAPFTPPHIGVLAAFGAGLWLVMWNYSGFDSVSTITEEIDKPQKILPRALLVSIIVIILGYLLPILGGLAAGGWQKWEAGSFIDIGDSIAGPWLGIAIAVGGVCAVLGTFSSLLMSNSRIPFVLAADGWLPRRIVRVSRSGTPVIAIIGCAVLYALFSTNGFKTLIVIDVFLTNITLLLELIALIVLRVTHPDLPRTFRIPGGWFGITLMSIPLVGVIIFAAYEQIVYDGIISIYFSAGAIIIALVAYFPARRLKARWDTRESEIAGNVSPEQ